MRAKLEQHWSPEMEARTNQTLRTCNQPEADTACKPSGPEARFCMDDSSWLDHLERRGFVVLSGVLDAQDVERAKQLLWEWLETHGMSRQDPTSWLDNFPGDKNTGICPQAGAPHSEFAWYVRSHPRVVAAFAQLWGVDGAQLISSFDAINVFRPFSEHPELKTKGGWLHLDQNSYPPGRGKEGKHCIQGLVTMLDANTSTGSLVVVPESHLRHQELCNRAKCPSGDFVPLQHNGVPLDQIFKDSDPLLVEASAGDLILWDSRTVHANTPASDATEHPPDALLRMVCYTCMTPRSWASDMCIRERQRAYELQIGSTHWPHEFHPRGALDGDAKCQFSDAPKAIQTLVGHCAPIGRPSDEAMEAMHKANELEAAGDLKGAKEMIDRAIELGHNCLTEYGGWK